jgi:hypothetical protein
MRLVSRVVNSRKCGQLASLNRFSNAICPHFLLTGLEIPYGSGRQRLRPGNDRKHPRNMGAELRHEVTEERRHRLVDNLSISGKDLR